MLPLSREDKTKVAENFRLEVTLISSGLMVYLK